MTEVSAMKRRWRWPVLCLLVMLVLGLGAALLALWRDPGLPPAPVLAAQRPVVASPPQGAAFEAERASAPAAPEPAPPLPREAPSAAVEPAHWHMADTRVAGDERAPPIVRSAPPVAMADWQLDHPADYLAREDRDHRAVQQAFVEAADRELPALRKLLDLAREQGLSPDGIAKGEEKLRRIAEQRDAMKAALAMPMAVPRSPPASAR